MAADIFSAYEISSSEERTACIYDTKQVFNNT